MWKFERGASRVVMIATIVGVAIATALVTALLVNIFERKSEARNPYVRLVEVTEDTTDPAKWGVNWPKQYDSYLLTAQTTRTRFGGHGGSEALPEEKIARDPWLKRMFLGYAFSIDYRDRRGHAYMLADQEATKRLTKPQTGSCLHCHASIMPLYRELGGGDAAKGLQASYKFSYQDLNKKLHDSGHAHPVSCPDCHDPKTMQLRVTRPGFIDGIRALAASDAPVPLCRRSSAGAPAARHSPTIRTWTHRAPRCGPTSAASATSSTTARRRCRSPFPGARDCAPATSRNSGTRPSSQTATRFFDYKHAETGAPILKAQHPEFELWSQGIHARSGVACADCHMPYLRDGATKISDHWVRSPLLNINSACQTCHRVSEAEIKARVDAIQSRNFELLQRGGAAITALIDAIVAAKSAGATPEQLNAALELQRKAQWRLDFIAAENSMGFHAPQEAAMVLGEALDYARQGELAATTWNAPAKAAAATPAAAKATAAPVAPTKGK